MATLLDVYMALHEKRITTLPPLRCSETLLATLNRLANADDRKLSDYVRMILERHVFGHAANLQLDEDDDK